jgi:hypothetical protein
LQFAFQNPWSPREVIPRAQFVLLRHHLLERRQQLPERAVHAPQNGVVNSATWHFAASSARARATRRLHLGQNLLVEQVAVVRGEAREAVAIIQFGVGHVDRRVEV